jgi:hypothetical protein
MMPLPEGGNLELSGRIESVWLRGQLAVQDGEILDRKGGYIARSNTPKRRHNHTTWI